MRPILLSALLAAPALAQPADPATTAFTQLKALSGTWRPADRPDSPLRITFSQTAGGTVLVEQWTRAGHPHSLTLYHRDGAALVAIHYCPQGNQPRLALAPGSAIRFAFRDSTDLDPGESHLTDLSFDMDGNTLIRRETYRQGEEVEASELRLVRAP